jgi:hypothetical protein
MVAAARRRGAAAGRTVDSLFVSHPALGAMPPDMTAGFPDAAARLVADRDRIGARALEGALTDVKGMRERYDELGLRHLLRDTEAYVERLAKSVASGDEAWTREWADWVSPVYRRRSVPMDDLIGLSEGLRGAAGSRLSPEERVPMDAAIDAAVKVFRYYRRIAGDARTRNRILAALYKGA